MSVVDPPDPTTESQEDPQEGQSADAAPPEPGMLLVSSAGRPACTAVPLNSGATELGRGLGALKDVLDSMMSRHHARAAYANGAFQITDQDSRNGSALDGAPLRGTATTVDARVLRLGHSLFLLCHDLRPFRTFGVSLDNGRVEGPALGRVVRSIAKVGRVSRTLFVTGETGAGKESLARAFHDAGPHRDGPFVAVNCATIPEGVAERLLFGSVKGAYSGAADSEGYIQAAHLGTLFLDEVGDLDPTVQAKLLRVLETGEVLPVGGTRPRAVQIRVCCATHHDLRALVAKGRFRSDLFFRIGVPQVSVPPLRQRLEEVPWHIARAVERMAAGLQVHVSLVEACLLRPWPGNVRELLAEVNTAIIAALAAGDKIITSKCLSATAGTALVSRAADPDGGLAPAAGAAAEGGPRGKTDLILALAKADGNISAAARALGLHRTQLRREMARHGLLEAFKKR